MSFLHTWALQTHVFWKTSRKSFIFWKTVWKNVTHLVSFGRWNCNGSRLKIVFRGVKHDSESTSERKKEFQDFGEIAFPKKRWKSRHFSKKFGEVLEKNENFEKKVQFAHESLFSYNKLFLRIFKQSISDGKSWSG